MPIAAARAGSLASSTIASASASTSPDGDEDPGPTVVDDLRQAADGARDHGAAALHRLERDQPEALAEGRDDDDVGALEHRRDGRDATEEGHRIFEPEPRDGRAELRLELPFARDLEREVWHLLARDGERGEQHVVALDRDQAADDREPRPAGERRRLRPRLDAVVDDLEARRVEALALGEVARQPGRDRDVDVGERGDGAIGGGERLPVAERVEAVLRRDEHGYAGEAAGGQAVEVGVDEVGVEDRRPLATRPAQDPRERARVRRPREADALDGDAVRLEPCCEVLGSGLALVEHHGGDLPAALAQRGQEQQEMVLCARDPCDLDDVEDAGAHRASATTRSAHTPEECSRRTVSRRPRPTAFRSIA